MQRPGALYDKRSHTSQILVTDLRLRVLADVLVDTVEELVNLALLVDIHLFFSKFHVLFLNYNYITNSNNFK